MLGIEVGEGATKVTVVGYGIKVTGRISVAEGVDLVEVNLSVDATQLEARVEGHLPFAAILSMGGMATFALEISAAGNARDLGVRAWNSLWLFGLLSLATNTPCQPLFAFSDEPDAAYTLVNRNLAIRRTGNEKALTNEEASWSEKHFDNYYRLIEDERFSGAMRAYNNAHYLFDYDQRLMLLWSGIEGLLQIDGELRRRIALHAAILSDGTKEDRVELFRKIKRAYDFRSRIVHGGGVDKERIYDEYRFASDVLVILLAKCVTLGRVPTANEVDEAALSASITE